MTKYLPTDVVRGLLNEVADTILPDKPESMKADLADRLADTVGHWMHRNGGTHWLMEKHWGHCDARIRYAMNCEQCDTLAELAARSDAELLRLPNFGRGSLRRLRDLTASG